MNAEQERLNAATSGVPWKRWGPYVSERQWGTVREDYSEGGDAWGFFTHDQARSRAYVWGEDGLAGISDDHQHLCFALALWNEQDPIIKERAFGLTNGEGNHGEDVKEYYFYLDSTPTHSYMKYLYKYPQHAYPYEDLRATNASRSRNEFEYELIDTGVFDDDRYFDVFVEYAKASPEDILIRIEAWNRGPDAAPLRLLPTLWFRNSWFRNSQQDDPANRPVIARLETGNPNQHVVEAVHPEFSARYLICDGSPSLLFCNNETNAERLWGIPNATPYVKDGINEFIVHGVTTAVNPAEEGTKMAASYGGIVPSGDRLIIQLRLTQARPGRGAHDAFGDRFTSIIDRRRSDADEFYADITPSSFTSDQQSVMRQALAGMLWGKQYYNYNVVQWMQEHGYAPPSTDVSRNGEWFHLRSDNIISMPDKWEYPWFAAWDLAFHAVALSTVDPVFAKAQLDLMLDHLYLHPNGQIPAYEWNFSDVNPPVHAWATYYVYREEKARTGVGDRAFLARTFELLMLNFTWWVNRKDVDGRNVFQGGFLGLDNIGVFDRSAPLPTGGHLEQADGTAWMALYCQNMLQIALELAEFDDDYEPLVVKFAEHFLLIASAMDRVGATQETLWDEDDGFFYDILRWPDGTGSQLKVRSLVGLLPLAAATVLEPDTVERHPRVLEQIRDFITHQPGIADRIAPLNERGKNDRILLSVLDKNKLRRVLGHMLDEREFLSPFGIRSISRQHLDHPYVFNIDGNEYSVPYVPAESDTGMFGGNSNWRGPVWFPTNAILIRALVNLYLYFGDEFQVECPTGSGNLLNLMDVSQELCNRLASIFLQDEQGHRPVYGGAGKFQNDPHWRDHILFYEYFHGDNGAGLGASHQTGWTGLVAPLMLLATTSRDRPVLGHRQPTRRRARKTVSV